jgi:hypothetical protein
MSLTALRLSVCPPPITVRLPHFPSVGQRSVPDPDNLYRLQIMAIPPLRCNV